MMTRNFTLLAIAFTLLALPAGAHHDTRDKGDRKIAAVARELQEAAHQLYCDAVEATRRPRWSERRALWSLRELDRQARDFARQVDRRGVDRRTAHAVHELRVAVQRAKARRWALAERREIDRGFARLGKLGERLEQRVAKVRQQQRDHIARHEERREHRRDRVARHEERREHRHDRVSRYDGRREPHGALVLSGPFEDWRWTFAYRY